LTSSRGQQQQQQQQQPVLVLSVITLVLFTKISSIISALLQRKDFIYLKIYNEFDRVSTVSLYWIEIKRFW